MLKKKVGSGNKIKDEVKHMQSNKEKWDKWASSYDSKNWRNNYLRNLQRKLIASLDIKEDINILDVGCGSGFAVGEVARLANYKGQFYGIDLSAKMIEKAKSNFSGRDNFHFIQANAESIPLEDNFFDIIICTNSFHHYLHPDEAVGEMHRLLRIGGRVYILDPTGDNWIAKILNTITKFGPEHVKLYSTKEFRHLFESAGLRYVSSSRLGKINMVTKVHIGEK